MISATVKFSESQKAQQGKKNVHCYYIYLSVTSKNKYWYHCKMASNWLEKLRHCLLGALVVLIFCNYMFHWHIFWYFTFNILWLSQSWRWSESFLWYCSREYSTYKYLVNYLNGKHNRHTSWYLSLKEKGKVVKLLLNRWWSYFSNFYRDTFTATPLIRTLLKF